MCKNLRKRKYIREKVMISLQKTNVEEKTRHEKHNGSEKVVKNSPPKTCKMCKRSCEK